MEKQILDRLQYLEDETSLLKEELTTCKLKTVRQERQLKASGEKIENLERQLKASGEKIEKLEKSKYTCKCEDYKEETIRLNQKVIQLEKQSKAVDKTCENLLKLQHLLSGFMLKAQKSSLQEILKPPVPQGALKKADSHYHSSISRNVVITHSSATLKYTPSGEIDLPVGQFASCKPLSQECSSFSFRIISTGKRCNISIGICGASIPIDSYIGELIGSIGYHAGFGAIYWDSHLQEERKACGQGDVMECQLDFDQRTVTFYKNGTEIFSTVPQHPVMSSDIDLYACITMYSPGEEVQLLEKEPWRQ